MALKSQDIYPQFMIHAWIKDEREDNGARLVLLDEFHDEDEALDYYNKTEVSGDIIQVDLDRDDGENCETIRQKDEFHEWA